MQPMQMQAMSQPSAVGFQTGGVAAEPPETRNLMVNYIPTTVDEVQLRQLFEMYGPIETVKIVCDRESRTSKGYGFVKYRFSFSAQHAIQYLNGYPLLNKRLKVAFAAPMEAHSALQMQAGQYAAYPQQAYQQAYHQAMPQAQMPAGVAPAAAAIPMAPVQAVAPAVPAVVAAGAVPQ